MTTVTPAMGVPVIDIAAAQATTREMTAWYAAELGTPRHIYLSPWQRDQISRALIMLCDLVEFTDRNRLRFEAPVLSGKHARWIGRAAVVLRAGPLSPMAEHRWGVKP